MSFDVIIAGGGAAGCVLAGRLSEASEKRVVMIEAGPDAPAGREHRDIQDSFPVAHANKTFIWRDLCAETNTAGSGGVSEPVPYLQGFGIGGGSSINGMGADRGLPADYDEWRNLGAVGWGWSDVLPYFKKLEADQDFSGDRHGSCGPIPIRRIPISRWAPFASAVGRALLNRGFPLIEDYNGDYRDGLAPFPMNCTSTRRVSSSMAYLGKSVRQRSNLTIVTNSMVDRLTFDKSRVSGVSVCQNGSRIELRSRETILCCGAVQTPALLMRSGIGPGAQIRRLGIPVVRDLAGVGRNLQNHPAIVFATHLPRSSVQLAHERPLLQNILRYSSGFAHCGDHDMLTYALNRSAWHPLGRRIGAVIVSVNKPYSSGFVELRSRSCAIAPNIRFNLFSDARDLERLVHGARFALHVLSDASVARTRNEVFLPNIAIVNRLGRRNVSNWLTSFVLERSLDHATVRRTLLKNHIVKAESMINKSNEPSLRKLVLDYARAVYHVCGTCKMGTSENSDAVVDSAGRVWGIEGLRIADASVFPTIPRANTHLTVLMVAEKMSDHVKASWSLN